MAIRADAQDRYRAHEWINTKTLRPIYSIQARVGKNGWAHVHEGGKPMFYPTAAERDTVLGKMNNGRGK